MAATGTVAGRPQPQTTAEAAGGPFIRHAPDGRRAMYVATPGTVQNPQFIANVMVSSPGWNKGYRVQALVADGTSTTIGTVNIDAPWNYFQLVQLKDAFGTQLITGPGFDTAFLLQLYGNQFGTDEVVSPQNLPSFAPIHVPSGVGAQGGFNLTTFFPFEFAKGYGTISGANAALLPVLQVNTSIFSTMITGSAYSAYPSATSVTVDADFYWLPNVAADPPGIGTTQQWIYQPLPTRRFRLAVPSWCSSRGWAGTCPRSFLTCGMRTGCGSSRTRPRTSGGRCGRSSSSTGCRSLIACSPPCKRIWQSRCRSAR